jgi:hypothetical protein
VGDGSEGGRVGGRGRGFRACVRSISERECDGGERRWRVRIGGRIACARARVTSGTYTSARMHYLHTASMGARPLIRIELEKDLSHVLKKRGIRRERCVCGCKEDGSGNEEGEWEQSGRNAIFVAFVGEDLVISSKIEKTRIKCFG